MNVRLSTTNLRERGLPPRRQLLARGEVHGPGALQHHVRAGNVRTVGVSLLCTARYAQDTLTQPSIQKWTATRHNGKHASLHRYVDAKTQRVTKHAHGQPIAGTLRISDEVERRATRDDRRIAVTAHDIPITTQIHTDTSTTLQGTTGQRRHRSYAAAQRTGHTHKRRTCGRSIHPPHSDHDHSSRVNQR